MAVIGLGYIGLPVALAFARQFRVIGYDINPERVAMLQRSEDPAREMPAKAFIDADIHFTTDATELREAHFFIIAVPTPVDAANQPDLRPLREASAAVGSALKPGDYVVYESTVYPGCTEEECLPLLESYSELTLGEGFKLGYSPERINPGDKIRTLVDIVKVVSGNDDEAAHTIAEIYETVIHAGVYTAPSIKVAEAAKVIENVQRDLNISLMNELAVIFDKLGIDTREVSKAAATKWNFMPFTPGLVGGHCIGIDPHYLLYKARQVGYEPQVINAGRLVNEGMPDYIATKLLHFLGQHAKQPAEAKVLVMGLTFKENVADIRNSKVADLVRVLMRHGIRVHLVDPYALPGDVAQQGLNLMDAPAGPYDAIVVAVGHDVYRPLDAAYFKALMPDKSILLDIKGLYRITQEDEIVYWRL